MLSVCSVFSVVTLSVPSVSQNRRELSVDYVPDNRYRPALEICILTAYLDVFREYLKLIWNHARVDVG